MQKILGATAIALVLGFSLPAFADTSEADCRAMYSTVDADNNGWIEGDEAKPYLAAMEKAGLKSADANTDGKLNADEFLNACMKDAFKDMPKPE